MRAKLVNEAYNDGPSRDYSEALFKIDKFLPEDEEVMQEYYDILDSDDSKEEKIESMIEFLNNYVLDFDKMYDYFPANGNTEEFAEFIINNM
jgi:hypothetical protein